MKFEYQENLLPDAEIIYVNSSSLKLASCSRRYAFTVAGIDPEEDKESQDRLNIGSAVHKFAEHFANNVDLADAIRAAASAYPDVPRATILACGTTRTRCYIPPPIKINGKPAVEFTFKIPWYSFVYEGTLYQLVLCGTMDHIAYEKDRVLIYDYKTSQYRAPEYALNKYKYSSQFAFYQWILHDFGPRLGLDMQYCNAIREGRLGSHVVPVMINAKEPLWVIAPLRSLSPQMFAEYKKHFITLLTSTLLPAYLDFTVHDNLPNADGTVNDCCQYCKFTNVCFATSTNVARAILDSYPIKTYNPTIRTTVEND